MSVEKQVWFSLPGITLSSLPFRPLAIIDDDRGISFIAGVNTQVWIRGMLDFSVLCRFPFLERLSSDEIQISTGKWIIPAGRNYCKFWVAVRLPQLDFPKRDRDLSVLSFRILWETIPADNESSAYERRSENEGETNLIATWSVAGVQSYWTINEVAECVKAKCSCSWWYMKEINISHFKFHLVLLNRTLCLGCPVFSSQDTHCQDTTGTACTAGVSAIEASCIQTNNFHFDYGVCKRKFL